MSSGVSARKWHRFPAQAATIFFSAQKKTLHSGAEGCHGVSRADLPANSGAEWCRGVFRADLATKSRAGGYIFSFQADLAADSRAELHLRAICAC